MNLRDFGLLTDENLDPAVVQWLMDIGFDVIDVCRSGLQGVADAELLRRAAAERRLIVSHDADFGTLAILQGEPVVGIIYLRPGHIDSQFTISTLSSLLALDPDLTPPFILVARRSGDQVTIRLRGIRP